MLSFFIDRPSKPMGPLKVVDMFKDRCRLSWNPPKDDGGSPITHYEVEVRILITKLVATYCSLASYGE